MAVDIGLTLIFAFSIKFLQILFLLHDLSTRLWYKLLMCYLFILVWSLCKLDQKRYLAKIILLSRKSELLRNGSQTANIELVMSQECEHKLLI